MLFRWPVILMLVTLFSAAVPAPVAAEPVPRMASLRVGEANLRTGPGRRYPIDWVFRRRDLPVEIVEENGFWRRIRDWEGTEGWVLRSLLSTQRTIVVLKGQPALRQQPQPESPAVARLGTGMTARVRQCAPGWCQVEVQGHQGWIPREGLWGVRPDEVIE